MEKYKVLVADPISQRGIDELVNEKSLEVDVKIGIKPDELLATASEYSAIVVRSQTKITAPVLEAATKLKAIGRAGVGVDNVDVETATAKGVIVMNTPGGNTVSTAEHAFSLLVSIARNIPQADASVKSGKWDRKSFEGVELYGKTLGILGMGRIGTEIARRAAAFGMRVLAYDPYLSPAKAATLQVNLIENIDALLPDVDFITMHMPLTNETKHMIDARRIGLMKAGVRIVNCARGGLIDEAALAEALKTRHVAAAALDVFEVEPPPADYALLKLPNIVFTPHLGASTAEAQESVGIEIALAIRAALIDGEIRNAVNMPNIDAKMLAILGPGIELCEHLGKFLGQISPKRPQTLRIRFCGKISEYDLTPMSRAVLTGYLQHIGGAEVNSVNAPSLAKSLGLNVVESKHTEQGEFTEWVEAVVETENGTCSIRGTFFGSKPRIVMINERFVELIPNGVVLMLENKDRPGMVGHIGSLLGQHSINIASMSLSRDTVGGCALTLLNLDSRPEDSVLKSLLADPAIVSAKVIEL